jgi:hypothetical protein
VDDRSRTVGGLEFTLGDAADDQPAFAIRTPIG